MNTHKRLQSKTAIITIITGRGRGIGKETAIFMPILKKKLHLLYDLKYKCCIITSDTSERILLLLDQ
jgi:hypothetical protein